MKLSLFKLSVFVVLVASTGMFGWALGKRNALNVAVVREGYPAPWGVVMGARDWMRTNGCSNITIKAEWNGGEITLNRWKEEPFAAHK